MRRSCCGTKDIVMNKAIYRCVLLCILTLCGCASPHFSQQLPYTLKNGITIDSWEYKFDDANTAYVVLHYHTAIAPKQLKLLHTNESFFGYKITSIRFEPKTIGTPQTALAGILVTRLSLSSADESLILEDDSISQRVLRR